MPANLTAAIDSTTAATLRARGSYKWTAPGPGGFGAAVAEMDFGAAPPITDALARLTADAAFGYLPPRWPRNSGRRAPSSSSEGSAGRSILSGSTPSPT